MSDSLVTIDFPQDLFRFRSGLFGQRFYDDVSISSLAPGIPFSAGPDFALWEIDLEHVPFSLDTMRRYQALMSRIKGKNLAFCVSDPQRQLPTGSGAGYTGTGSEILYVNTDTTTRTPATDVHWYAGSTHCLVYEAAERYADSLVVSGLPVSTAGVFVPGDWVEIGGNLYMVLFDADSDANGRTRIQISWKLWKPALANDVVKLDNPSGRFVLADRNSGSIQRQLFHGDGASLVAIEVPYQ